MTNFRYANLLEIDRSASKIYTIYSSLRFVRELSTSRRSNSESERRDQQERKSDDSGSHRGYHRRSYERKRDDYQRERDHGDQNRDKSIPFLSRPSTTYYQRLNIDMSADQESIKSAYYALSKRYHPDIVGASDPDAVESFRLITDAYEVLTDPKKRADYDRQLIPEFDGPTEPIFTSWRPKGNSTHDQENVFRMRESHRIFQTKQDEALAREKARNPNKFRSGVFKRDVTDIGLSRDRLYSQLQHMDSTSFRNTESAFSKTDSNEFYRTHLYATLLRKRDDLIDHDRGTPSASTEILWPYFASLVGALAVLAVMAVNVIYDFDLADTLDRKLSRPIRDKADDVREK